MGPTVRDKYLNIVEKNLPKGATILELGCGAGMPMTKRLTGHFRMVGLDISKEQLSLAVKNVSKAEFILADMTRLPFAEGQFDAVAAFYCITHVPREEHIGLLNEIRRVLKPGGLLVVTMGRRDTPGYVEPDWLGAPMFFSHYDGETNTRLVKEAGFNIICADDEPEQEFGEPVCFRWIVASKV